MDKRRIAVVTGSRAEYGLLTPLLRRLRLRDGVTLQLVVTSSHLSEEFGCTYGEIERDGFPVAARVQMLPDDDGAFATIRAIARGVCGSGEVLDRLKPDLLVLTGDRYEMLAAAQAALVMRLPVGHIFGGDTTAGAFDEAIRHSISKMAHLHFVSNELAARRVRQLGEDPTTIFNVGSLGVDAILQTPLLSQAEVERQLGFRLRRRNLLVTFHPVTLTEDSGLSQCQALLQALDRLGDRFGFVFTMPNADPGGRRLAREIEAFVSGRTHARAYASLGRELYLSTMAQVDAVIGNSSSGLYEAPTLKRATVNVGDRQQGRIMAESVLSCEAEPGQIIRAIENAIKLDCSAVINPYGDGHAAERIVAELLRPRDQARLVKKTFHDLCS